MHKIGSDVVDDIVIQLSEILEKIDISDLANSRKGTLILIDRFLRDVQKSELEILCSLYISKDYFIHMVDTDILRIENLKLLLRKQLQEFQKDIKNELSLVTAWRDKIAEDVLDTLWGCKERCMFCKEPCKYTDKDHLNTFSADQQTCCHSCIQHRPLGIGGWRKSSILGHNFCNRLLKTELPYKIPKSNIKPHKKGKSPVNKRQFKYYKEDYGNWGIVPTNKESKYWIWVLVRYQKQLAEMHKCAQQVNIPKDWYKVTKEEALQSLR